MCQVHRTWRRFIVDQNDKDHTNVNHKYKLEMKASPILINHTHQSKTWAMQKIVNINVINVTLVNFGKM